ncbi:MAG TPA: tetratricopeptide repeat protein, partial [Burkholderiaceae bacterium]|nr:tetratricopeptide repeat protein [Burkholderiaceae bacterium]
EEEAWLLIGSHVSFDVVTLVPEPLRLCIWYERAADAGVAQAGLTWARLELAHRVNPPRPGLPRKALAALEQAAHAGLVEAQWLLAQELKKAGNVPYAPQSGPVTVQAPADPGKTVNPEALAWATRAAANGVVPAQRALAERAWAQQDKGAFLGWALPVARALETQYAKPDSASRMPAKDAVFLARCAQALSGTGESEAKERKRFWELAAEAGDKQAQFALGAWFANMDERGERNAKVARRSNYRKAVYWLTLSSQQGLARAWYALYKIHLRSNPSGSQHRVASALRYLERAAEAGHGPAQLEMGKACRRSERQQGALEVRAAFWLQKAAAQGEAEAHDLLSKIAGRAAPLPWAQEAQRQLTHEVVTTYPLLAARIELAALFGLTLPEALLLDLNAADHGHCLVIDIRSMHGRSKPRLILIETGQERLALERIGRHFANIECGVSGPEGNYRQRCYLARKVLAFSERGKKHNTKMRGQAI